MAKWAEYRWQCSACGAGESIASHERREFPPRYCAGRSEGHEPARMDLLVRLLDYAERMDAPREATVKVVKEEGA